MLHKPVFFICFLLFPFYICFSQQPKLMLPIGHTKLINSAQFSPDGKRIVTASSDKTAKVWDVASGYLLLELKGHTGGVSSVQFSPDGNKILTASFDSTAKIWDAETGKILIEIKGGDDGIRSAQFSPDGNKIVTPSMGITAKIWDANTGKLITDLKGHSYVVWGARFSPDGQTIVTNSSDSSAKIWDANTGKLLVDLRGHRDLISSARFSPDGKKIVTTSSDKTAIIWNVATGSPLTILKGHTDFVFSAQFSPDGKKIVTASSDKTAKIWDAETGNLLADLKKHNSMVRSAQFSPNGKTVLTASDDKTAKIWDAETGNLLADLTGHNGEVNSAQFSPDGKKIVTASADKSARIWDANTGKLLSVSSGHTELTYSVQFSSDSKKIITNTENHPGLIWDAVSGKILTGISLDSTFPSLIQYSPDGKKVAAITKKVVIISKDETGEVEIIKIWDVTTGKLITELKGDELIHSLIQFSPDGKKIVTVSGDNTPKLWDVSTGKRLVELKGHFMSIGSIQFSPDGKKIMTSSNDISVKIWDVQTGTLLKDLTDFNGGLYTAQFSPDGKKIITAAYRSTPRIWDAIAGKPLVDLKGHTGEVAAAQFSPDGKKIVTASEDNTIKIWDPVTGKLLATCVGHKSEVNTVQFSPDNKKILSSSHEEKTAKIWDATTGALLNDLQGHDDIISDAIFSPDGKSVVTISRDNTIKKWDVSSGQCLYTFFAVDQTDYLVVDNDKHYDGTKAARKLLYFVCGTEVVGLDQVKDELWVPNLAGRINNGETINAKTVDDLDICGLTPEVEVLSSDTLGYRFKITARRGGLGETVLYINGIEAKRYKAEQLKNNTGGFELRIKKDSIISYFMTANENRVSVKAYTANNVVSSAESIITVEQTNQPSVPPNLYAVMVGISDYKGEGMDLNYAAIDAEDLSSVVSATAKKLLNMDGKEHVFMYNLTTDKEHYLFPEKKSIKQVLDEIGTKATANDILFIFLSGHGTVDGDVKKQFYYLTADASPASMIDAYADVGISTAELTDWIRPQIIKAQKRILILDACNSGQAINDIVKLGNEGQSLLAAKGDDKPQMIKAIDKLNEKSGLFILSASSSSKNAFESDVYSHGYLTYSLLKAIKQQPDILEDGKFLNVSRWFNAAGKTVSEMAKANLDKQEPQIVTTTDFNIGVVDADVMAGIKLSEEKQLFSASNFQNSDTSIADDDLELGKLINLQLANLSSKGAESKIAFALATNSPDACHVSGRYTVKGNTVTVTVNLRQNKIIASRFITSGTKDKLEELAASIADKAVEWAASTKK